MISYFLGDIYAQIIKIDSCLTNLYQDKVATSFSETYVKRRILLLGYMGELCKNSSAFAEMGDRLATIDIDRNWWGLLSPFFGDGSWVPI